LKEINLYELESDLTSSMNHIRTSKTLENINQLAKMQANGLNPCMNIHKLHWNDHCLLCDVATWL